MKEDDVVQFAKALVDVKRELTYCSVCGHITENDPCYICEDKQRDRSVICVVEDDKDVIAMEKMRRIQRFISRFTWVYFAYGWNWTRRY